MIDLNSIFTKEFKEKLKISEWGYTENSVPQRFENYKSWIDKKNHEPLGYLADERMDKRADLKEYFSEFKSAIVLLFSYKDSSDFLNQHYQNKNSNGLKISSYTLGFEGHDYHLQLRASLEKITFLLKEQIDNFEFKLSIDMHPVLERDLAARAGLGWQGKNSMLITRNSGSFFIIASILTNQRFENNDNELEVDHCGKCTRCVSACPTNAIDPKTRTIVAKDCISTFTIEEFKLDTEASSKMTLASGYIFGCDICQDVCPWNKRLTRLSNGITTENFLNPIKSEIFNFFLLDKPEIVRDKILNLSNGEFRKKFKNTSFERSGKRGILKNLNFYLK